MRTSRFVRCMSPIFASLCALVVATSAPAAIFCVSTSGKLDDALAIAAANGEDDVMNVSVGNNNNFWNNNGADLYVFAAAGDDHDYVLRSKSLTRRIGDTHTSSSDNISVESVYESGLLNFAPVRSSPLWTPAFLRHRRVNRCGIWPHTICAARIAWLVQM